MIAVTLPFGTLQNAPSSTEPYLHDLTGWLDSITIDLEADQRPNAFGYFDDDEPEAPGRAITVFGEYRIPGGDWEAFQRQVNGLATAGWFDLEVTTGASRFARVRVAGQIQFDLIDERGYADFSIPLLAPDPRRYGPLQSASTGLPVEGGGVQSPVVSPFSQIGGGSPGRVTMTNEGSADTVPLMRVTGGLSEGVELTRIETAQKLRLEWPLLDTDIVTFDAGDGQVWLNDQSPIAGYLTISDWWTIAPGEIATIQFEGLGSATGTPTLTAEWRDADS